MKDTAIFIFLMIILLLTICTQFNKYNTAFQQPRIESYDIVSSETKTGTN